MRSQISYLALLIALFALGNNTLAFPYTPRQATNQSSPSNQTSLPQYASNATARAKAIALKREGWLYGPPLLGGSFFPTGPLASARIQSDVGLFSIDDGYMNVSITADLPAVAQAVQANGGLNSLDDYANVLYNNEWTNAVPSGPDPGILTNYTQDLLFSMERLSLNPYSIRRVKPDDTLPFTLTDSDSMAISTLSFTDLQSSNRLFIADHSDQSKYPLASESRYGAFCTAYFFIHPTTSDLLPLAIKTNTGSDLIYTPLDSANDWLFAKMLFGENDIFHGNMWHLLASHEVGEIVHLAAMRTLSDEHPVLALLEKLMTEAYAIRPVGFKVLFNPGGIFDQNFFLSGAGAIQYVNDAYPQGGAFKANYLENDLLERGLIGSKGPALKSFPFYEDAREIRDVIRNFMTTFISTYYTTDSTIAADTELQAWFAEAQGSAEVIDFPCSPNSNSCGKRELVEILTHFAFLTGVVHHALNTGDPVVSLGTLPFHPMALYTPLPPTKNLSTSSLLTLLPPPSAAIRQIAVQAGFNRPQYAVQNRTLVHAYSSPSFLSQFESEIGGAEEEYRREMEGISARIRSRGFDELGMSQGMPFIWKSLDPGTVPYFFAV